MRVAVIGLILACALGFTWLALEMARRTEAETQKRSELARQEALNHQLFEAVKQNDKVRVDELVAQGASAKASRSTLRSPLRVAAYKGSREIARVLLDHGADPNELDGMPLNLAAIRGDIEFVRLLVADGADVSRMNSDALTWAVRGGNIDVVKYLVAEGADLRVWARDKSKVRLPKTKDHEKVAAFLRRRNIRLQYE